MFRNNYQGGAVVELFSGQGKDPTARWRLFGGPSAVRKEFDKEVKGFVYCLEGSSQTVKMQMPENGKQTLGLLQRFLVLQVNVPQSRDFSIELVITDSEHLKRRLHLSTVHKEMSVNPLHAKIPFVGLKRNHWSTLCIDLVSFTRELFKGFMKLDVISLFATCKVRRIFTMKTEPAGMSDGDMCLNGAGLVDLIPRSCQFPPDVSHVTQVLNVENLQKAGLLSSDSVSEKSASASSTCHRRSRPPSVHTAAGSRVSGPPTQTGRKITAASDRKDISDLQISNMELSSSELDQTFSVESGILGSLSETFSHGEPSHFHSEGTPGSIQPHPLKDRDKPGCKKLRFDRAGRERQASLAPSDALCGDHIKRSTTREKCTLPPRQERELVTLNTQQLPADECNGSPVRESCGASPTAAESLLCLNWPGLSGDLQVCSSWENNKVSEPQLAVHEEVFSFSSQLHSGQGDQEEVEKGKDQIQSKSGRRHEPQPEDDFVGSESDEDNCHITLWHQKAYAESNPATATSPSPALDKQIKVHNIGQTSPQHLSPAASTSPPLSSGRFEPSRTEPTRCLSPNSTAGRCEQKCGLDRSAGKDKIVYGNSSVSLSRSLLQEVKLDDFTQYKMTLSKEEEYEPLKPVDGSVCAPHLLSGLRMCEDDVEQHHMLASLKREQEEDECRALGLSASQIHQCNVSIGTTSDNASTWTHISLPANRDQHYQKEMNPLLHLNPREWMDVLSPPIMPPGEQRRSDNTRNNHENLIRGGDESLTEEEDEDEYLNLHYDPCLSCYFDPKTGKYYELA